MFSRYIFAVEGHTYEESSKGVSAWLGFSCERRRFLAEKLVRACKEKSPRSGKKDEGQATTRGRKRFLPILRFQGNSSTPVFMRPERTQLMRYNFPSACLIPCHRYAQKSQATKTGFNMEKKLLTLAGHSSHCWGVVHQSQKRQRPPWSPNFGGPLTFAKEILPHQGVSVKTPAHRTVCPKNQGEVS